MASGDASATRRSRAPGSEPTAPATAPPANFEQAIEELETLVHRMEAGELSLEDSLAAYRRGTELATFCRQSLARVQQQVKILEGDLLKTFEPDGEDAA